MLSAGLAVSLSPEGGCPRQDILVKQPLHFGINLSPPERDALAEGQLPFYKSVSVLQTLVHQYFFLGSASAAEKRCIGIENK